MRTKGKQGFTLIEMVVVMAIMVSLAGILIPKLTGYIARAKATAAASNIGELQNNLELYNASTQTGYPDGYDAKLVTTSGALDGGLSVGITADVVATPITAAAVTALNDVGIVNVYLAPPGDMTFTEGTPHAIGATENYMLLTAAGAAQLGLQGSVATGTTWTDITGQENYIVLGVGANNQAVSKTMVAAPVYAGSIRLSSGLTTDTSLAYARYFAVYAIPSSTNTIPFDSRLVGVLDANGNGLQSNIKAYNTAK